MKTSFMPQTASVTDIQRNYRAVFNRAQKSPVIVLTNNVPEVAIVKIEILDELELLRQKQIDWETEQALEAIRVAEEEEKEGKLLSGNLRDLVENL